jgi:hypothetical protein
MLPTKANFMEHTHTNSEHTHESHTNPTHTGEHHAHESNHHAHEAKAKMMGHASALEAWLVPIFAQVPHMPSGGKKVLTDIIPWLSLIFGILGLIGLLGAGAVGAILSPFIFLSGGLSSLMFFVHVILGIVGAILGILSFTPLQAMKKNGWNYAFYSLIIGAVSTVLGLFFMYGGLSGIVGILIGAYLLFEIRDLYHK